jgi:hypothetical protein
MATACSSTDALRRDLLWAGGYALVRAALSPFSPVPGALPLDPLPVAAASTRNLLLLLPGLLLGDILAGLSIPAIATRTLGFLLLGALRPRMTSTFLYWTLHFSLWTALPPDYRGEFALSYVYLLGLLQALLWSGILPHRFRRPQRQDLQHLALPMTLVLLHLIWKAPALWPLPTLGSAGPLGFRLSATLLLLAPALRFIRRPQKSSPRKRWVDLVK